MISGLVLLAGCGGGRSAEYYDAIQAGLRAEGKLRTETDPPDAPYGAADLVRNFERIALFSEADISLTGSEKNRAPNPVVRWDGPINYSLLGSAVMPEDRIEVARLMDRIATLTGLEIAESEGDINLMIMITTPGERRGIGAALSLVNAAMSETFARWRHSPELVCYGSLLYPGEGDYRIAVALISIGSETRGLLRRTCLHEEIVQSFGLFNDHPDVRPSIFNDDQEFALLTGHDENLLRILYDPRLAPGMVAGEAMPIVERIVAGMALAPPVVGDGADGAAKPAVDAGT